MLHKNSHGGFYAQIFWTLHRNQKALEGTLVEAPVADHSHTRACATLFNFDNLLQKAVNKLINAIIIYTSGIFNFAPRLYFYVLSDFIKFALFLFQ